MISTVAMSKKLGEQEDEVEKLSVQLDELSGEVEKLKTDLATFIEALNVG